MMKREAGWMLKIGSALVAASAVFYALNYLIFGNPHEMFFLMMQDIAFLFLNVLLVILLIERLLARREKQRIIKNLNMVIGTFFSEVGLGLLALLSPHLRSSEDFKAKLDIKPGWSAKDFQRAAAALAKLPCRLDVGLDRFGDIKVFLAGKRGFLVQLLENPNLLEHERFTDLLWAVFHLAEELSFRPGDLLRLPPSDYQHLLTDTERAYSHIAGEWIAYTAHLKTSYPYLFSLAVRINPFAPAPSAVVIAPSADRPS